MGGSQRRCSGPVIGMLLEIRPVARDEFDEAADWYRDRDPAVRDDFVAAVELALRSITDRPLTFPIVFGSKVRRTVVKRFPYSIFFTYTENLVIVFSIFNDSRNPMIWRGRIG